MKNLIIAVAILLSSTISYNGISQSLGSKLGHINSAELLSAMPEVKQADSDLQAYAQSLDNQYSNMVKEYQTKAQEVQSQLEGMDELIRETKIRELAQTEENINKFQVSAQEKVAKKKEELYGPILEKADQAIKAVSESNGFTYIFDSSLGVLLFAGPDSQDILPLVKTQLGI